MDSCLARRDCYVLLRCYFLTKCCCKIKEVEREEPKYWKVLWRFNDSQNKGYLYAESLVGRKSLWSWEWILAAKCLSEMCVAIVKALSNVWVRYGCHRCSKGRLLVKDRNDVVTHECVVLVIVTERHESLLKMLPRDEVAGCLSEIACCSKHS